MPGAVYLSNVSPGTVRWLDQGSHEPFQPPPQRPHLSGAFHKAFSARSHRPDAPPPGGLLLGLAGGFEHKALDALQADGPGADQRLVEQVLSLRDGMPSRR